MRSIRRRLAVALSAALLVAACANDANDADRVVEAPDATTVGTAPGTTGPATSDAEPAGDTPPPDRPEPATTDAPPATEPTEPDEPPADGGTTVVPADLGEVAPGVEQLTLTGGEPDTTVSVIADRHVVEVDGELKVQLTDAVAEGTVDAFGSLVVRALDGGAAYWLLDDDGSIAGPHTTLTRDEHPPASFFAEQRLPAPGFGYLETRDGTLLSVTVQLPGPVEDGPYPTVVEYSGYTPSDPEASGFGDLFVPLGYAYVGVNMRGSGCSGGSFRFFEYTQSTDGYDAIEAVAAQPWSANVGMVGVSYPGISQLFVAQTQPPSLAAITPLSVIDDAYRSTLYPGGLLNTGFAVEWTQDRLDDGRPAVDPDGRLSGEGQGWAGDRIAAGDETCAANQSVRLQNPDLVAEIRANPFYDAQLGDEIAPRMFVEQITVPTFLAGAWQDEQTGGRFATMIPEFTGTDRLFVSLVNGLHTESIGPGILPRYLEFLDLYVAERTPSLDVARSVAPVLADGLFGVDAVELPPDRFAGVAHAEALAAFEAEPPVQVLFEEGAADGVAPLTPLPRFVESFAEWPIPGTEARRWYFTADGGATPEPFPAGGAIGTSTYLALPDGVPPTFWDGNSSDLWRTDVVWDWAPPAPGTAAVFTTPPLDETLTMVGSGSVDLHLASNLGDTDVEVTLSEIRPDGTEVYVQSGWLRASHRTLDESASTELRPVHGHLEADAAPLPDGTDGDYALTRVEIFPFAHVFRAGSSIRVTVDAPGGNRAVWEFETIAGGEQVTIAHGATVASSVVLPVIPDVEPPAGYPPADALRGQPSRPAGN